LIWFDLIWFLSRLIIKISILTIIHISSKYETFRTSHFAFSI
jgi:hypothetical protein